MNMSFGEVIRSYVIPQSIFAAFILRVPRSRVAHTGSTGMH